MPSCGFCHAKLRKYE